jgi:tRNA G18 (ribose-2'-O)-methylase SpoU
MPITDWTDLMPHTVTVAALSSRDAYGKPTRAAATSYTARVTYKTQRVASQRLSDSSGDVLSRGFVILAGTPNVGVDDLITLPDSSTPVILAVDRISDEDGLLYTKVYFGGN